MANNIVTRHFDLTLTQGSADAFVQGVINTEIVPENGIGLRMTRLEMLKPYMPAVAAADRQWSITRDTKTAVANLSDPDCMYADGDKMVLVTSGAVHQKLREENELNSVFVVEPQIYIQLDSTATTLTNTFYFRLHYEEVKLSEVEILRLLNNV